MATLGRREGLRGFCLFTTLTRDPTVQVHSRFFAPHYGVPEDPATGSVYGPLAVYLWRYRLIQPHGSIVALVGKQGEVLGRSSRLHVEVVLAEGTPQQVRVGGEAVTVMSGTLELPRWGNVPQRKTRLLRLTRLSKNPNLWFFRRIRSLKINEIKVHSLGNSGFFDSLNKRIGTVPEASAPMIVQPTDAVDGVPCRQPYWLRHISLTSWPVRGTHNMIAEIP
jgi:Phenazine biosynthesis-like protein